jgi:hypothetical protein
MDADVATVVDFVAQVRVNCRTLVANPFNARAGEALADLMLEAAPLADEALARITAAAIEGRAGTAALVGALADRQI